MYVKKWKFFVIIDKEVDWLNQMSKNGYNLIKRQGFIYYFQQQPTDKYQYQIEFIGLNQSIVETQNYLNFLTDSGIDVVFKFGLLLYLKRNSSDTDFIIYSSSKDLIRQYIKVIALYFLVLIISFLIVLKNLITISGPYFINVSIPLVSNSIISLVMVYGISVNCANILTVLKNKAQNDTFKI